MIKTQSKRFINVKLLNLKSKPKYQLGSLQTIIWSILIFYNKH